jgi:two-component system, chemotaxis family, protein-glutamate methylesterase/glutaminase
MTTSIHRVHAQRPIRVLIIDDSALVRTLLTDILESDPGIQVIGTASDAIVGLEKIAALAPDVITLDIEMPRLDGLSMLDRLMPLWPLPVVMISALTTDGADATIRALELGAVDFIAKPTLDVRRGMDALRHIVVGKVRLAATASGKRTQPRIRKKEGGYPSQHAELIAIGASTGGVAALNQILPALPHNVPPLVITQHMPPVFTQQLANRLNKQCAISVSEAVDGEPLRMGHAYIAPGDKHFSVRRGRLGLECALHKGDHVSGHMPSVDVLFGSIAKTVGNGAMGILLTGMGRDGALGLLQMRESGSKTYTQDEATSLVFGMPQAAVQMGASLLEVPLAEISKLIINGSARAHPVPELAR